MDIYTVDKIDIERKYWFIRSGKEGVYGDLFKSENIVSIGHYDSALESYNFSDFSSDSLSYLKAKYKNLRESQGESLSVISSATSQVERFINEINIGDMLICSGHNMIMAGVVKSDAYFSESVLKYETGEKIVSCSYNIRRKVSWGRRYLREQVPIKLERSFKNPSTVFELKDSRNIINQWLQPFFFDEKDTLHFSSRIEKKEKVSNRNSTIYSSLLDDLEVLSYKISKKIEDGDDFNNIDLSLENSEYLYALTTQQSFMSPGDYFTQLPKDIKQGAIFALLLSSIFGAELSFANDIDHGLTQQNKEEIKLYAQTYKNNPVNIKAIEELELKIRKPDELIFPNNRNDDFPVTEVSQEMPM